MDKVIFTTFRQGARENNVHLSDVRLVKDAFARVKVATAQKIKAAQEGDMDFEDRVDYERDLLLNYGGAVRLMREIERLCGMQRGELITKSECDIYVPVVERMAYNG
jgi:hypothetical protein